MVMEFRGKAVPARTAVPFFSKESGVCYSFITDNPETQK